MLRLAGSAVVLLALALPAGAVAAPPWSAPVAPAQPAGVSAVAPGLAFARDGGILSFSTDADPSRPASPRTGRVARVTVSGLGATRAVCEGEEAVGAPQAYGAGRTLVLTRTRTGGSEFTTGQFRIGVRFGRVDATLDPAGATLARGVELDVFDPPVLAANARGAALAAWIELGRGGRDDRLWVSTRAAGGRFGRPTVLVGTGSLSRVRVAVGERGDVAVAFQRTVDGSRRVQARVRPAGGSLGALDDLGPSRGNAVPDVAVTRTGRAVVAWQTYDVGEEVGEPTRVYAAVKPAGPSPFRDARLLDPGSAAGGVRGRVAVAAAADGTATVAWNGKEGRGEAARFPLRTARVPRLPRRADGRSIVGGAQEVGVEGQLQDVAVAADGTTALAWTATAGGQFEGGELTAALRPVGAATFGPPEAVSTPGGGAVEAAVLAFPVGASQPVTAWLERGDGQRSTVRVARRGG